MPQFGDTSKRWAWKLPQSVKEDAVCGNAEEETCQMHDAEQKTLKRSLSDGTKGRFCFPAYQRNEYQAVDPQDCKSLHVPFTPDENEKMGQNSRCSGEQQLDIWIHCFSERKLDAEGKTRMKLLKFTDTYVFQHTANTSEFPLS
jgi:hypothetical protein